MGYKKAEDYGNFKDDKQLGTCDKLEAAPVEESTTYDDSIAEDEESIPATLVGDSITVAAVEQESTAADKTKAGPATDDWRMSCLITND